MLISLDFSENREDRRPGREFTLKGWGSMLHNATYFKEEI